MGRWLSECVCVCVTAEVSFADISMDLLGSAKMGIVCCSTCVSSMLVDGVVAVVIDMLSHSPSLHESQSLVRSLVRS